MFPTFGKGDLNTVKCKHKRNIASLLLKGKRLTAYTYAIEHKSTKLGSRISELRADFNFPIKDIWCEGEGKGSTSYKEYFMEKHNDKITTN